MTELRNNLEALKTLNISRSYTAINSELKSLILCPKWRSLFLSSLVKAEAGYTWNFNFSAVHHNLVKNSPSNLASWAKSVGLYPGRSLFAFPEHSRYVHLNTNTLPMYSVCPKLYGFNQDIFAIQGDDNTQSTHSLTQVTGYTRGRRPRTPSPIVWPSSSSTTTACTCCCGIGTRWATSTSRI